MTTDRNEQFEAINSAFSEMPYGGLAKFQHVGVNFSDPVAHEVIAANLRKLAEVLRYTATRSEKAHERLDKFDSAMSSLKFLIAEAMPAQACAIPDDNNNDI